jgi:hypothetical protein
VVVAVAVVVVAAAAVAPEAEAVYVADLADEPCGAAAGPS